MNRKSFLGAAASVIGGLSIPSAKILAVADDTLHFQKPPYLKEGDVIGITSPAGFTTAEQLLPAKALLESWGYRVVLGDTIGKRDFSFGGTDEERLADLQRMLDDPGIKAILCARGGYGSVRIVDQIKWTRFKMHPKWVIGFSDITVLHSHIHRHCAVATIHSKMTNSFPDDWTRAELIQMETIISIRDALNGRPQKYTTTVHPQNKQGRAEGVLVGGNLKTLESLAGSSSDISTDGKILFIEDTGEYLYSIDRMMWNLKRTGKLKSLKALVVGGFRIRPDDPGEEFGRTLQDIILEKVHHLAYPVCFDFPVGHQRNNFALKCGVRYRLEVSQKEVVLTEII